LGQAAKDRVGFVRRTIDEHQQLIGGDLPTAFRQMSRKYAPFLREFLKLRNQFGCSGHSDVTHCGVSLADAFRTFAWEIPNCRAIRDGVMPALKAARTAFT
jgi:hypothetical protein